MFFFFKTIRFFGQHTFLLPIHVMISQSLSRTYSKDIILTQSERKFEVKQGKIAYIKASYPSDKRLWFDIENSWSKMVRGTPYTIWKQGSLTWLEIWGDDKALSRWFKTLYALFNYNFPYSYCWTLAIQLLYWTRLLAIHDNQMDCFC